jgi:phage-related protein/predicted  nucleic acid-binding Zn-ribbon protein
VVNVAETVKGLNIKLGLDTSELDTKLTELKGNLKEQNAELKAINNGLKYDSTNIDLWKQKQTTLNATLEATKAKLDAQNQRLEEAKKAVSIGAMSEEEFNKMKRGVTYTEAEVANLNNELERTAKKIDALGNAKWDKLAKVGSNLTKYVTVPIAGAVTALTTLTVKSMNTADEIADNASKVYLSAEAYQEWAHACSILAVDTSSMQKAFVKVNSMLGDIASGNTTALAEKLKLVGLTVEDLAGLNTDQAFSKLRDALAGIGDEATRTAVANEIFGDKLGGELTQVLTATSDEISNLRDEAKELGIVTDEQADIAGAFTDQITNLKQSLSSLGYAVAVEVVPVISSIAKVIQEKIVPTVKKWIEAWHNLSSTTKVFIGVLVGVLASIGPILTIVGKIVPMIKSAVATVKALNIVSQVAGKWWLALIAILAVLLLKNDKFKELLTTIMGVLGGLIDKVMELVSAIVNALMPIITVVVDLLETIIDLVVGLVMDILDPIIDLINVIIGIIDDLIPIIKEICNELTNVLVPIIGIIKQLLGPISEIIKIIIGLVVQIIEVVTKLIDSILSVIIDIISVIGEILGVIIDLIVQVIDIVGEILTPILEIIMAILEPILEIITMIIDVISIVMELLSPLINVLLQPLLILLQGVFAIIDAISPVLMVIANIIQAIIVPVLNVLFQILEPILTILNKIIEAIKWLLDKVNSAFGWLGDLFGNIGSWFSDTFNLGGGSSSSSNTTNNQTTNNITVNTTSSEVDVDALNRQLGDDYL